MPTGGVGIVELARRLAAFIVVTCVCVACSGGGGGSEGGGSSAPRGSMSDPAVNLVAGHTDACALVNESEASSTLDGDVEAVPDPAGEGLVTPPNIGEAQSLCYYRPTPDDGERFVATVLFAPGSVPDATFEQAVGQGTQIAAGPNYAVYDVDGSIVVHKEDQVLLVVATTDPGSSYDRDAGLKLGLLAAARMPASDATPDNHACELLTPRIVSGALDGTALIFGGGQVIDPARSGCEFAAAEEWKIVDLLEEHGADIAAAFQAAKDDGDVTPIPGLGDEAFDAGFGGVWVISGDEMLHVIVTTTGGERDTHLETLIAQQVVDAM